MKISLGKWIGSLIVVGASALAAQAQAQGWNGTYAYERTYGKSTGGSAIGEQYVVTLGAGGKCRITMTGFQTDEDIVCRVTQSPKAATLHFKSYHDGKTVNRHGVRVYKKDQRLLTFEKGISEKQPNVIRTVWHDLSTLDGKKPKGGVRFKRVTEAAPSTK